MFIVGLTGGIGSGKSNTGNYFRELGVTVIDADIAARKVVKKGSSALTKITAHFGSESLLSEGNLNRAFIRARIFEEPKERQWLESLLHPLIRIWIQEEIHSAKSPYVILESPLLLETDQHQLTDRILVIDVPEELQVARATNRDNNNQAQIRAIMQTQMSRKERLTRADDILDNSGSVQQMKDQAVKLHQRYLTLSKQNRVEK